MISKANPFVRSIGRVHKAKRVHPSSRRKQFFHPDAEEFCQSSEYRRLESPYVPP